MQHIFTVEHFKYPGKQVPFLGSGTGLQVHVWCSTSEHCGAQLSLRVTALRSLPCPTMCQAAPSETEGKTGVDYSLKKARKLRLLEKGKEVVGIV